jgi:hypothetical protein
VSNRNDEDSVHTSPRLLDVMGLGVVLVEEMIRSIRSTGTHVRFEGGLEVG